MQGKNPEGVATDRITLAGVGNAAIDVGLVELGKNFFTKNH